MAGGQEEAKGIPPDQMYMAVRQLQKPVTHNDDKIQFAPVQLVQQGGRTAFCDREITVGIFLPALEEYTGEHPNRVGRAKADADAALFFIGLEAAVHGIPHGKHLPGGLEVEDALGSDLQMIFHTGEKCHSQVCLQIRQTLAQG